MTTIRAGFQWSVKRTIQIASLFYALVGIFSFLIFCGMIPGLWPHDIPLVSILFRLFTLATAGAISFILLYCPWLLWYRFGPNAVKLFLLISTLFLLAKARHLLKPYKGGDPDLPVFVLCIAGGIAAYFLFKRLLWPVLFPGADSDPPKA